MKCSVRAIGVVALATATVLAPSPKAQKATEDRPVVVLETTEGIIKIELWKDKAPISVDNFIKYVESGHYDDTIFHRVIPGFMVQAGGFTEKMTQKKTRDPIKNEAKNGCKNDRGTLAMARTSVVDSATSQFFINLKDNAFLNHGFRDFGYAVFAKVAEGMDIVDSIAAVKTTTRSGHQNVPATPVVIKKARVEKAEEAKPAE